MFQLLIAPKQPYLLCYCPANFCFLLDDEKSKVMRFSRSKIASLLLVIELHMPVEQSIDMDKVSNHFESCTQTTEFCDIRNDERCVAVDKQQFLMSIPYCIQPNGTDEKKNGNVKRM